MRAIKRNMKDQILTNDRKILHCVVCDTEWSGIAEIIGTCPKITFFDVANVEQS